MRSCGSPWRPAPARAEAEICQQEVLAAVAARPSPGIRTLLDGPAVLPGRKEAAVTFTVDIHHHMLPDFFWRATNEGDHPVGGIAPPPWSRASALSFLDDAGIDVAVTSISTPGVHTGDDAAARALARRCNELAAERFHDLMDALMAEAGASAISRQRFISSTFRRPGSAYVDRAKIPLALGRPFAWAGSRADCP